jgi:hypothetical protein
VTVLTSLPPRPTPWYTPRSPRRGAAVAALLGLGAFVAAACLSPYEADGRPRASGTHRQLGLPPCHFQTLSGLPCPACGMTTSLSLVMHGDLASAWRVNWAGVIVGAMAGVAVAWLVVIAVVGVTPGRWTVERTIEWLALGGVAVAMGRYLTLGIGWCFHGAP